MNKELPQKTFSQFRERKFELPNLLGFQEEAYDKFLKEDLSKLLEETFPIEDSNERFKISYVSHSLEAPKKDPQDTKEDQGTYSHSLKVKLELENKVTKRKTKEEVYLGEIPAMTAQKTFIINGNEKTIVSQAIRSNGIRFTLDSKTRTRRSFVAQVMPEKSKGQWLYFETDSSKRMFVKFDQNSKKIPVTTIIRAFGPETKDAVIKLFKDDEKALETIKKTFLVDTSNIMDEVWQSIYKNRRVGSVVLSPERAKEFIKDEFSKEKYSISQIGRFNFNKRFDLDVSDKSLEKTWIDIDDIVLIVKEIVRLNNDINSKPDDVDHLGVKKIRTVRDLVGDIAKIGLFRVKKNARDKMLTIDPITFNMPTNVFSLRTFQTTLHSFFNTNQLSQYLKQQNLLNEIEHVRTISAMGQGGMTKQSANIEARDVHYSHYGKICPVHAPDGGSIGLVLKFSLYAKLNSQGLLVCPYFKVKNGVVTDEVEYLTATEEDNCKIGAGTLNIAKNGKIEDSFVLVRSGRGEYDRVSTKDVEYVDVSTSQIFSISTALIPFAHNTIPVRASYGSRMQQQAIPCFHPEAPLVATGYEKSVAEHSGRVLLAQESGEVVYVDASKIEIKNKSSKKEYKLNIFRLVNSSAHTFSTHQRPVVSIGDKVEKGQVIADVASTQNGQLAVGKNLRVAFLPFEGATFEDAIVISNRLVKEDVFTSVEVKEKIVNVRESRIGVDVITSDIPNVSESKLRNLDADGIIRVGSYVYPKDILVGKLTPKGEVQLTSEEKLLQSIFGEKAKDMKDTSEFMQPGEKGKVVSVQIRSREQGHNLDVGVVKQIKITIADIRPIQVGDKLANRYGNKGVISKIAQEEDMPYTEDGEPIDIILSPLGVPSRKNLGQILEMHLGLTAKKLGYQVVAPPFTAVSDEELEQELEKAGCPKNGKFTLYDGKTGNKIDSDVAVGYMYVMKLEHMVENKVHSRSTGPYVLITQQPIGGKSRGGGQRLGEMEVWALLGHGAAYTLREMLTVKSDDMRGRERVYNSIIQNDPILQTGTPAAFNVLLYHLRGLCLNVDLVNTEEDDEMFKTKKINYNKKR